MEIVLSGDHLDTFTSTIVFVNFSPFTIDFVLAILSFRCFSSFAFYHGLERLQQYTMQAVPMLSILSGCKVSDFQQFQLLAEE